MPTYRDAKGAEHEIEDWPGTSHKAKVINRAYRRSEFIVAEVWGSTVIFFKCGWCKRAITSAGVHGDHVATQKSGKLSSDALMNLELSCTECNSGSRNKSKRMTRKDFKDDRRRQGPSAALGFG